MTIAVLFGGMSCEHDISIITGLHAFHIASIKYNVIPIYIDSKGVWWTGKKYREITNFKDKSNLGGVKVFLKPGDNTLYFKKSKVKCKIDVAIVCCHGLNGEDGSLQGLLQLSGIAYTGSSVLSSAVGMDKITMKRLFSSIDLPIVPYVGFEKDQFEEEQKLVFKEITDKLTYPLIVKPSNLGSSIGINIVKDGQSLLNALNLAFEWDSRVIIENALTDFIEINCAVIGGHNFNLITSELEQPAGVEEFLTFNDKYSSNGKLQSSRKMPADLDDCTRQNVRDIAKSAFKILGCSGVVRCDFLLTNDEQTGQKTMYINEVNTIPGLLSSYMFEHNGFMSKLSLLENLILIALQEKQQRQSFRYSYYSNVLLDTTKIAKK
ncbi:MAG: D-alanine--D-alanine ligase [Clostridiales bacterium]|jgi:D-alanine-D-alanine ligase|nr:D-alanine--D-alanine ligase [Clostridiales bacterium]